MGNSVVSCRIRRLRRLRPLQPAPARLRAVPRLPKSILSIRLFHQVAGALPVGARDCARCAGLRQLLLAFGLLRSELRAAPGCLLEATAAADGPAFLPDRRFQWYRQQLYASHQARPILRALRMILNNVVLNESRFPSGETCL